MIKRVSHIVNHVPLGHLTPLKVLHRSMTAFVVQRVLFLKEVAYAQNVPRALGKIKNVAAIARAFVQRGTMENQKELSVVKLVLNAQQDHTAQISGWISVIYVYLELMQILRVWLYVNHALQELGKMKVENPTVPRNAPKELLVSN